MMRHRRMMYGQPMGGPNLQALLHALCPVAKPEEIAQSMQMAQNQPDKATGYLLDMLINRTSQSEEARRMRHSNYFHNHPSGGGMTLANYLHSPYMNENVPPPAAAHTVATPGGCVPPSGKRKALIVGINYTGTRNELGGCQDDATRMKQMLIKVYGFVDHPECMELMMDTPENRNTERFPTHANMIQGMKWLAAGSRPGDVLFFHYSGHGSQEKSLHDTMESDGMDETICPVDFDTKGQITDNEMRQALVDLVPDGVKLVVVFDCCHSGTALDLPYNVKLNPQNHELYLDTQKVKKMPVCDSVLLSGCSSTQTSADVAGEKYGKEIHGGAMTMAFMAALLSNPYHQTHEQLIKQINEFLKSKGFEQTSQMSSAQKFPLSRVFSFENIIANSNPRM